MAAVIFKHADQPIVESADFQYRNELVAGSQTISRQPLKEIAQLLRLRRDLASQDDVAVFITKRHSQLTGVLIDTKE